MRFVFTLFALVPLAATAADPLPDYSTGRGMIADYFRGQSKQIADACLSDLTTRADWKKRRRGSRGRYGRVLRVRRGRMGL